MTDEGARAMMAAAFTQAIKDYEHLCTLLIRGKIAEKDGALVMGPTARVWRRKNGELMRESVPKYSFTQIERFIELNAEEWVDLNPYIILDYLRRKKGNARRAAYRKFK